MADQPNDPGGSGSQPEPERKRSPNRLKDKPSMQLFQSPAMRSRQAQAMRGRAGAGLGKTAGRSTLGQAGTGTGRGTPTAQRGVARGNVARTLRGRSSGGPTGKTRSPGELIRRASLVANRQREATAGSGAGQPISPTKAVDQGIQQGATPPEKEDEDQQAGNLWQSTGFPGSRTGASAASQPAQEAEEQQLDAAAVQAEGPAASGFGTIAPSGAFGGGGFRSSGAFGGSSTFGSGGAFGSGGGFGALAAPSNSTKQPFSATPAEDRGVFGTGGFGGAVSSTSPLPSPSPFESQTFPPASTPATPPTSSAAAPVFGTTGGAFSGQAGGFGTFSSPATPLFGGSTVTTPAAGGLFGAAAAPAGGQSQTPQSTGPFGVLTGNREEAKQRRAARFGAAALETLPLAEPQPSSIARSPAVDSAAMEDEGEGAKGTLEGTCTSMCPDAERSFRERMRDVDSFERAQEGGPPVLAVKKFARNVEQLASNFRTLETLQRTQAHLLAIMDREDVPLGKIHHFLWDRCRGVRQDLFVQGYEDAAAVAMYEEHVRFMILAEHELAGHTGDNFNSHLNLEQINKACISLNSMYDLARAEGQPAPNEGEFRAYHLLLLMGTHGKYKYNSTEYRKALKECEAVKDHPDLKRALELSRLLAAGSWASFLRRALDSRYLLAALANLYFPALRAHALTVTARTQGSNLNIAFERFLETLQLDTPDQAERICEALQLNIVQNGQGVSVQLQKQVYAANTMPIMPCQRISAKAAHPRSADVTTHTTPGFWDPSQPMAAILTPQAAQASQEQLEAQRQAAAERRLEVEAAATDAREREAAQQQAAQEAQEASRREAALRLQQQAETARQARKRAEEQARLAALERERLERERQEAQRIEAERRRAAEQAAREREAELQRQREEQRRQEEERRRKEEEKRRQEEEARRRAEAEAEAKRQAAEAAEHKRREEERLARAAAERRRLEAEAAARRREQQIQRNRAAAAELIAKVARGHTVRSCLSGWLGVVFEARNERTRKEEARLQNLAGCRIGPPRRLDLRPAEPITARSPPLPQAGVRRLPPSSPSVDVSPALAALVAEACQSGRGPAELFFKLCLLHTGPTEPGSIAGWLQQVLLQQRVGDERACVAVRMIEAVTKAGTAHILRAAVRDVSAEAAGKAVPQAAVAGTSAVLLFIDESDEPQQVSVVFRRLLAALPTETSASGGPALAVLVGSVGLAAPIEAWLEAEVASELGNRLGRTRVIPLPGSSQNAMETSLMAALCWAASNSPAQPQLQVRRLGQVVTDDLEDSLARLATHWTAGPQHYVAAFNSALAAARGELSAAARVARGHGAWPPADCISAGADTLLPSDWFSEDEVRKQLLLLEGLELPVFDSAADGRNADTQTRRYLVEAGISLPTSAQARIPWRQALAEAFSLRLGELDESAAPAVTLLAPKPKAAAAIPSTPPPVAAKLPPVGAYKRKSPPRELPTAKMQRRVGPQQPIGTAIVVSLGEYESAGTEGEPEGGNEAAEELRREAEAHTAWIRGMLEAADLGVASPGESRSRLAEDEQTVESELADSLRFQRALRELSGGF